MTNPKFRRGSRYHVDLSTKKHPGATMIIDIEDYDRLVRAGVGMFTPHRATSNKLPCAVCKIGGVVHKVHRLINPGAELIDHINRNPLDNRRSNLARSNKSLNALNMSTPKSNKSGTKGVCFDSSRGRWKAYITLKGKTITLGRFSNKKDAVKARKLSENLNLEGK
tara:strand:- start:3388 stop:3885 length:498 start_codon:yes stop_codon:yes gene_type:complete